MKIRSLLPIACWGDHLDVFRASESIAYCQRQLAIVDEDGLRLFAIRNALAGQLTCDPNDDSRSDGFAPAECRVNPGRKRQWGVGCGRQPHRGPVATGAAGRAGGPGPRREPGARPATAGRSCSPQDAAARRQRLGRVVSAGRAGGPAGTRPRRQRRREPAARCRTCAACGGWTCAAIRCGTCVSPGARSDRAGRRGEQ